MKIGAACKWLDDAGNSVSAATFRMTTIKKLNSLTVKERFPFLLNILDHNLSALRQQILLVGKLPEVLRMWRIGSDVLPVATHATAKEFYENREIIELIDKKLLSCGNLARKFDIRLSFHPGQFVVLGSRNPGVRENSLIELQYHCDVFTRMGYTGWHPNGLAVNVHVGVKDADIKAMRKILTSAPSNLQNMLTLENDEFSWGAQDITDTFGDLVPIVLDVHHYWIYKELRLKPTSKLAAQIKETWRGIQPKLHLSMSRYELCQDSLVGNKVLMSQLLANGKKKRDLRAHSDTAWYTPSIDYASRFGFDIMWEGKDKNLGAQTIRNHLNF